MDQATKDYFDAKFEGFEKYFDAKFNGLEKRFDDYQESNQLAHEEIGKNIQQAEKRLTDQITETKNQIKEIAKKRWLEYVPAFTLMAILITLIIAIFMGGGGN